MTGPAVRMPDVPRPDRVGIVHLGLGAFHRAHQAVFTDDAMLATGDRSWGICGVTQRSDDVLRRLAPRDNRYTLLERGPGAAPPRVVGSILQVLAGHRDPAAVVAAIARPSVRIVTLTVTEKGYRHDPATGELDLTDPEIRADLAGRPPRTVVGQLAAGIAARGAAPLTVVCCDNLPDNGRFLRGLVERFTGTDAPATVRFPATMVDRIVPAATDADRAEAHDDAVVVAEPFRQWVIEDDFATDRPAWDQVGAEFTADVAPWERLKLRVLNACHSLLAYLGLLGGYELIADAVADPLLRAACQALVDEDVRPVLTPPSGVDTAGYGREVLRRFANPALRHTTRQVASDGSQKLGPRLLTTAADGVAAGRTPRWVALATAAWLHHVTDPKDAAGHPIDLVDPLADALRATADPLGVVLPADLAAHGGFRAEVGTAFRRLAEHDPATVIKEMFRAGS